MAEGKWWGNRDYAFVLLKAVAFLFSLYYSVLLIIYRWGLFSTVITYGVYFPYWACQENQF